MLVYIAVEYSIDILDAVDRFPISVDTAMVQIELDSAIAASPVVPATFNLGLYTNDPLQIVVDALEDAVALLSPLEQAGHAAIGSIGGSKIGPPSPADDDCLHVVADFIGSIVIAAEEYDQGTATFMNSFQSAMESQGDVNCGGCIAATSIEMGDWNTICGNWIPSSVGIQTLGNCEGRRHFTRNVVKTREKTYTRVCPGPTPCTVLQCQQFQTQSFVQREYGPSFDMSEWACTEELVPGSAGEDPQNVQCRITWFDKFSDDFDDSGWVGDCSLSTLVCP